MQQFELQIEQTYQFPRQVSYNNFQGNEKKSVARDQKHFHFN